MPYGERGITGNCRLWCVAVVDLPPWRWESFPEPTAQRPLRARSADVMKEIATGMPGGAGARLSAAAAPPVAAARARPSRFSGVYASIFSE